MNGKPLALPAIVVWLCAGALMRAGEPGMPAEPVVFWASDPVRPGETVMAFGAGFGEAPGIEVAE